MHNIFYYVNTKDLLYIKGCEAIERKDKNRLSKVLKDPTFDSDSFEASGLLHKAAQNSYIKGFQMLGDAGVKMYQPLEVLERWQYVPTDGELNLEPVSLTEDETALHTLIEHINAEALTILDLEKHFKSYDIERTLNTYVRGKGTPLQLAYESHLAANRFLSEHNSEEFSTGFWYFYARMLHFQPNVQAPLIGKDEMLFQKAIRLNDQKTLSFLFLNTVNFLNMCHYRYPKKEYEI